MVLLRNLHGHVRVDVADKNLVLGIRAQLIHDLLRIDIARVNACALEHLRDAVGHVVEAAGDLVIEELLLVLRGLAVKVSFAGGLLLLLLTQLVAQARG